MKFNLYCLRLSMSTKNRERFFKLELSLPNCVTAVSLVVILFLLFKPNSGELASWVQAVGSILAIVAAAYIPFWHAKVASARRLQTLLGIMGVIADDSMESLWTLTNVFYQPEKEESNMFAYQGFHKGRDWQKLLNQLDQIPLAELSPAAARSLSILKDSVSFGAYVASLIPKWIERGGHSQSDVVQVLRGKRDLLGLIRQDLPRVLGSVVPHAQTVGSNAELKRPPLEPISIDDAKIYRRYVWPSDNSSLPEYVYIHGIYPYVHDFGPYTIEFDDHWKLFSDVDTYVRGMCLQLHREHLDAMYIEMGVGALGDQSPEKKQ